MTDPSYGTTFVHRLPAGLKLFIVFFVSIGLFYFASLPLAIVSLIVVWFLFVLAGFPFFKPVLELKKISWLLVALFIVQYFSVNFESAALIVIRLSSLLLLATLVTLTTPFSKMMACFEKLFSFMRVFGVNPAKISLGLSLTLRFIAVFSDISQEVREAQKARGLEKSVFAVIMPVLIRSLKVQADVAAAIEARCFDEDVNNKNGKN
ncbi:MULTISPECIES: energy-coupling factor transporter transmembrane protein EcfT [Bartonella]|uniref:energy-coupling factor transporter transmembrane component T family protein n=1 Tax=Bartonella TaxID=773 RepID=UPI0018DE3D5E|nr:MULTISPECIES: energy-coupling factor transporter transmembrane component T [Bartonella]MBH9995566.1 energy-coupling factor transporter transmembrane protein EcfT [Bartonella sp. P0291]MBH9996090.1 energy-coupling factor transporter transmembrane protein EcfT [Bartonella sp. M0192]MBH9998251.1 energy-coupling factor transporter transmembrane protein EcfT [Bartonella sp. M0191]MBI0008566.1 energy-coupling factor transporter transmembrane protein EcfT [Bartonella sp. M0193]MBI0009541.1 energy-